ncbi:MAG: hypothetical protein KC482_15480 [Dehalococcoidia bacterium]|nr:hypothetical protein [Dehalococcoidia bacterium]MCA9845654.1 hypothetical protein [Dehalococcoidia bacterium]MCA9854960.1 hypothetical protein [Dehalococcoidia bacterium]
MKKPRYAWIGAGLFAIAAVPAAIFGIGQYQDAQAQGFPPEPPATYYGTVGGAAEGDGIAAAIGTGASSRSCGNGAVLSDSGSIVYVVDVITDDQTSGCGDSGRTIRFYIAPQKAGAGGKFATQTANWQGAGAHQQNLTAGPALTNILYTPQLGAQVTN